MDVCNLKPRPLKLSGLAKDDFSVRSMACGDSHFLLLTESGQIWSCGRGENGQLGLGSDNTTARWTPQHVRLPAGNTKSGIRVSFFLNPFSFSKIKPFHSSPRLEITALALMMLAAFVYGARFSMASLRYSNRRTSRSFRLVKFTCVDKKYCFFDPFHLLAELAYRKGCAWKISCHRFDECWQDFDVGSESDRSAWC